jgi:hypothetical protein
VHEVVAGLRNADDWREALARVGLVAKGISYGLVGLLAIGVALGIGGKPTSRQGALQKLAGEPFGKVVLVLLGAGFMAYALWRLIQVTDTDEWLKRIAYAGRAAVYGALIYSTVRIIGGAHQESQDRKAQKTTGAILGWPGGRWLVFAGALVLIGVGVWNGYRGVTRKFDDKWKRGPEWGVAAGVVGHLARFVVFTLIGAFAFEAALNYDPNDAMGLDGALRKLADAAYGRFLLGLTAAGLIAYGVYCFLDARYRDVSR